MKSFAQRHLHRLLEKQALRRSKEIEPFLVGNSLLDLGAAEGWIAQALARNTAISDVTLVDVIDINKSDLPLTLYDGHTLPFEDKRFSTTLLLFSLHHCENPQKVLSEAIRVTHHRLIISESLFQSYFGHSLLCIMDNALNSLRSGSLIPQALHFQSAQDWEKQFIQNSLQLRRKVISKRGLHHQALFVLDCPLLGSIP